ncbi:MAG: hypothetical protein ACJ76H_11735 [Bacteriovoracaceae bacterium]
MRSLAIVLALSSFSAVAACPNLAGKYASCRSMTGGEGGSTDVVVTQKEENGVTTYTITSTNDESQERETEEMIVDGQVHTQTTNDPNVGEITSSETYTCGDNKVLGTEIVSMQGQEIASLNVEVLRNGNAMEMNITGTVFGQEASEQMVCE